MKTERIKVGEVYMAVVKGNEIKVRVDCIMLDHILGTNVERSCGIVVRNENIVAGPLKDRPRLSKQE